VSAGILLAFIINKLKFKFYQPVKQEIRQITATSSEVHTVKNRGVRSVSVITFKGCDAAKMEDWRYLCVKPVLARK
jgi:hypothetical protein